MKTASELQHDVLEELKWEPSLQEGAIGVSVHEGAVTLSGHVESYAQKLAAEAAAKRVLGVRAVANDLIIRLAGSAERDDTDLADAALQALKWNIAVPEERVRVTVRDGWLTLEGEVEWHFQKAAAYIAVRTLTGVKGVINEITLKPKVTPRDVQKEIRRALHRSATVDAEKIQVETQGSKVILRGTVRSWSEFEDAQRAAWAAPGVTHVENHLMVEELSEVAAV